MGKDSHIKYDYCSAVQGFDLIFLSCKKKKMKFHAEDILHTLHYSFFISILIIDEQFIL